MDEFSVNPKRFDPYRNFKFRIKWDGRYVAGISKISGLRGARPFCARAGRAIFEEILAGRFSVGREEG
jgi:hypothetical protein